jgi:hypothetical protein
MGKKQNISVTPMAKGVPAKIVYGLGMKTANNRLFEIGRRFHGIWYVQSVYWGVNKMFV